MPLSPCPKCGDTPRIEKVRRTIGELYRLDCCGMIVFGDPIQRNRSRARINEYTVALLSAYTRWNEAVEEVKK